MVAMSSPRSRRCLRSGASFVGGELGKAAELVGTIHGENRNALHFEVTGKIKRIHADVVPGRGVERQRSPTAEHSREQGWPDREGVAPDI